MELQILHYDKIMEVGCFLPVPGHF